MQRLPSRGKGSKPPSLKSGNSFGQSSTGSDLPSPSRNHSERSLESPAAAADGTEPLKSVLEDLDPRADVFETPEDEAPAEDSDNDHMSAFKSGYEELPIEIQSLMERFLESLALKVHPAPLSTERLSALYQDFYVHAFSQIEIHIAALSTKISREVSPTPSGSSGRSVPSLVAGKRKPLDRKTTNRTLSDHQMLTASEVADRRKARRQLEFKRLIMEELVERGVCEKVYPRIWRHGSTDDEARDEKLRSRAAALNLVGVNLKELLSTAMSHNSKVTSELEKDIISDDQTCRDRLNSARTSLLGMNEDRYPLGKLTHLTAVHKYIVEALQDMFPSVSSADEVLPTLIYTIITMPPESNCIVSNFNFIQRFRASIKIDGEAAYCLTNLEAAISFLENVDLGSIRSEELPEGPHKSSTPLSTPYLEKSDPLYRGLPSSSPPPHAGPALLSSTTTDAPSKSPAQVAKRHRRLSSLRPLESASGTILSSADNIHSALDGGFKYLFGKLREKQAEALPNSISSQQGSPTPPAPQTLEDAKKLVSPEQSPQDRPKIREPTAEEAQQGAALAEKALELILGKSSAAPHTSVEMSRDRSVDSSRSNTSIGKKSVQTGAEAAQALTAAIGPGKSTSTSTSAPPPPTPQSTTTSNPLESMRNLGNSLNPIRGLSGLSLRGFGRSPAPAVSPSTPPASRSRSGTGGSQNAPMTAPNTSITGDEKSIAVSGTLPNGSATSAFDFGSIGPAIHKFLDCKDVKELNFYDVDLLLRDYQRLAGAIRAASEAA